MQQFKYVLAVAASVIVLAGTGAVAQQPAPAISGAQKLTVVPASKYSGHVYVLTATLETTQWGWFDNAELPRLVIDSGDTVVLETMPHAHGQLWPGRTIEEIKKLRTDWPGRGPMSLTGPIFVNTAEPGDSLRIKIQKIVPRPWGSNFNIPGMFGEFPKDFPDGQVKYFYLDGDRKIAEFAPGIEIPLRPFPGTLGVARVLFLGYPDCEVEDTRDLRRDVTREIRRWRPDLVITMNPHRTYNLGGSHRDHRTVGHTA